MKKGLAIVFVFLWSALLFGIGAYYVYFAPQGEEYSENENRMLHAAPDMRVSFKKGTIDEDLEAYLLDRFPFREKALSGSRKIKDQLSTATYEQYLQAYGGTATDALSEEVSDEDIEALLAAEFDKKPTPRVTNTPAVTPDPGGEVHPSGEPGPVATVTPDPADLEDPPIEPKPQRDASEFPDRFRFSLMKNGTSRTDIRVSSKKSVLAVTAVLNKYADLLPEGGKLMFTVVPQSTYINSYVGIGGDNRLASEPDELINAMSRDNVYAFDTPEILSDAIISGEYVFFRTDMHWTPLGAYKVYCEMAKRAGKVPCDYEWDFTHTTESHFLGTMYRSNPSSYLESRADTLEILEPHVRNEVRRIVSRDTYKEIPFIDLNAKSSDRFTVYLGGPAGPWTIIENDNGETENCLILMDSFGLDFVPFLCMNYHQVHYYDPRYFNAKAVGGNISDMINKYDIRDIYVIVGDLHCFDHDFLITQANKQLTE